jgi:hypothetical protein
MTLVQQHTHPAQELAAGLKALPDTCSSFAFTQATWRFYRNERVSLERLAQPLLATVPQTLEAHCGDYGLVAHDWSRLGFNSHTRKHDRLQMTHGSDVGYELQSAVLLSDATGKPLVPIVHNVVSADQVYSTMSEQPRAHQQAHHEHLDDLTERIGWIEARGWDKPLVHIVDREGDSVGHLRAWAKRGYCFLVRADNAPRVCFEGHQIGLEAVAEQLTYSLAGSVQFKGVPAQQWIAHTSVVLTRPARPARQVDGKRVPAIPGEPLAVRLVVSRIYHDNGQLLAQWLLLTNVSEQVDATTVARWYYYRWQIESMFKLLKSAGLQLENWLQDDGLTLAKRLVVASCACVLVWQLAAAQSPLATEAQRFLVRLSGRQTKRTRPITAPAMLAGLWMLFSMLEVLEHYDLNQLRKYAQVIFPNRYPPQNV